MNDQLFQEALAALPDIFREKPPILAIQLGSGWNKAVDNLRVLCEVPYAKIPHLGGATVIGHSGSLLLCEKGNGHRILCWSGRRHWYEGCEWETVVMSAVLSHRLGCPSFLVTNASGAIRTDLNPGDLVILRDHIRLSPLSPLRGEHNPLFGPRFPDQTEVYSAPLRARLKEAGLRQGLHLTEGVFALASGPAYETPAEIRAYGILGADLVGMSTVPEVMVASSQGMSVAGISFVANMAAGISGKHLDGEEVVECARQHTGRLSQIILDYIDLTIDHL